MSLLRTGVVLAAVIALVPSEPEKQRELFDKVSKLAGDAVTYCERNEDDCRQAGEVWSQLKDKAGFAAALAYDILARHGQLTQSEVASAVSRGTLTPADLEPAWRGSSAP